MGFMRITVLSTAAVLCLAAPARAQDDYLANMEEAKTLYQRAEAHYAKGEFEQALQLYEQAYQKAPEPMFLLGIGQAYKALDRCEKAQHYFERYVVNWPEAPNREVVERLIKACREQLARQRERERQRELEQQRQLELERQKQVPKEAPPEQPRGGLSPIWFWSGVALSGALLATGAITGGIALAKNKEYKEDGTSVQRRLDLRDQGQDLQTVSTVTFIAGGVAAGATAVLYFFTGWGKERTQVSAGVAPSGGTLVVQGRF